MTDFTRAELLTEVSKIFRAGLSPGSSGGTLNTTTEYRQLLEMAAVTFLLNPDSVFYIARLAANQLNATLVQEVAVLEDILVSLDDLGQIGAPVRDTATLSNARTAVLSLDAAQSVTDRPETDRFIKQMDSFAEELRKNLVSSERGGAFVRPREEARGLILENLASLELLHERLLDQLASLLGLLDSFLALDLPARVSTSVLSAVSSRLAATYESVAGSTDVDNLALNRKMFLEALANKISVKALTAFSDPTLLKYRSPPRPIPPNLRHYGRVIGDGEPASVLTSAGPWELPISAPLVLSCSGGSPISIGLDDVVGAVLNARNSQAYVIPSDARNLHVIVDPEVQEGSVSTATTTAVTLTGFMPLGFKHLGAAVAFPDFTSTGGSVTRDKTVAVVTSNIAADTNVTGAGGSPNLDAQLGDYSSGDFVQDVDIFVNGVLVRNGADASANHDVYPGTTPANGDLKFEWALTNSPGTPDVITMVINGGSSGGGSLTDLHLRFIEDLRILQTAAFGDILFSDPTLTVSTFSAGDEGAIGFQSGHVGAYIKDSAGERFEVIQVISATQCVIDVRGKTPDFSSGLELRGQFSAGSGTTNFNFLPALTTSPSASDAVRVGPSIKTAQLTAGSRTAAQIVSDIESESGVFDTGHDGAKLNWHVKAELVSGDPTRVCLRIRSKMNPFIQISGRFLRIRNPVGAAVTEEESAHLILGYREGESDTTNLLSPSELADLVGAQSGLSAEVVTVELAEGLLETVPTLSRVTGLGGENFSAIGVQANDQVEIRGESSAGTYRISSIPSTSSLDLDRSAFDVKESGLPYRIFREQVRIYLTDSGPNTYLTTTSSPAELGLSASTVYSLLSSFEAVDKLENRWKFSTVVPGDLLKVVGQSEVAVSGVSGGTTLLLERGLPSTVERAGFEIRSASAKAFSELIAKLKSFSSSSNLLKKNRFDEGVELLDNACTTAILPGQNFTSSRNQAKRIVAELLSILSDDLHREDEYTSEIVNNPNNLSAVLASYEAVSVTAVDNLIDAFVDRKYDRAADLLRRGRFTLLYETDDETGSFSGAVMSASRAAVKDLPRVSRTRFDFLNQRDLAKAVQTSTDADEDFSDTENDLGELDL